MGEKEKKEIQNQEQEKGFDKIAYNKEYTKTHYKRIPLELTFDKVTEVSEHIKTTGESRNGFIKRAIDETMERDREK